MTRPRLCAPLAAGLAPRRIFASSSSLARPYRRPPSSTPRRHASTSRPSGPEIIAESPFESSPSASSSTDPSPRPSLRQRLRNPTPNQRRWLKILGYSMLASTAIHIPIVMYLFSHDSGAIAPYEHVPRLISKMDRLTPRHKYLEIPLEPESARQFGDAALGMDGGVLGEEGAIAIQHIMIKSPAIQVERSYTPVNDVEADGGMQIVVKRVRGGEVGRVVFSTKEGERLWIRGPITTCAINPYDFDRIVMISTGTGVAPFLQFLAKFKPSPPEDPTTRAPDAGPSTMPKLHLIHTLPPADHSDSDWPVSLGYLPRLEEKFGGSLSIHRTPQGPIPRALVAKALGDRSSSSWTPWRKEKREEERVMVILSLPPAMMDPLCGRLTPDLHQGELTGVLKELGLKLHQVWKLE